MTDIHKLLKELYACNPARYWAANKTWEQIYNECPIGEWLCWLFNRTNPDDIQLLTLVKGHQANTVRHLMKDERSINAVDAAIAFGEGKISLEELNTAAADAAYAAAYADAADAAYAAYAAAAYADAAYAYAADAAAYAAAAVYAADAAAYAAAKKENQQLTAEIFRKFIPIEKFNL